MTLYFDDHLTVATKGDPKAAAKKCAEIVNFVIEQLEGSLRLTVSVKKSVVVASNHSVAAATAKLVRKGKLRPVRAAKMLGTATTAGRSRCSKVTAVRIAQFDKLRRRLQQLRKLGVRTEAMVQAAGSAAMMYGVDVMGISDSSLQWARSVAAAAASTATSGKSVDRVLLTADGNSGTMDPAFLAHLTP